MNLSATAPSEHHDSCQLIILGASGDLTKRLLLPSLFNLATNGVLADDFRLLGVATEDWNDDGMRAHVKDSVCTYWGAQPDGTALNWLMERTFYQRADLKDADAYRELAQKVKQVDAGADTGRNNRLFYLALAPSMIAPVAGHLAEAGMFAEKDGRWSRLIIEKPFGNDKASAIHLNGELLKRLDDAQIYRIDHFAGKDALHDIAVVRFTNPLIESVWHSGCIDHVQITVAESMGVDKRGKFYEETGALRDMVPNHIAELIAVTAMERPATLGTDDVRGRQVEVMRNILQPTPEMVGKAAVRGQYAAGTVKENAVPGYRDEADVPKNSNTETFVAMRLEIKNARWSGVPFYIRVGKRLAADLTEIVVVAKNLTKPFLKDSSELEMPRGLRFRLKPDNSLALEFSATEAGLATRLMPAMMSFVVPEGPFCKHGTGYERLLHDAIIGNQVLFQSQDFVEAGWGFVQPFLDAWGKGATVDLYPAGSDGPTSADDLLARDGRKWRAMESA